MRLTSARIRRFRNILDSTEVKIEERVTCLIGKNESGKSAILNALWRLKPAGTKPEFTIHEHYPAWLEKRHRNEGVNQQEFEQVEADLEWEPTDVKLIEEHFGQAVGAAGTKLRLWSNYGNEYRWESGCNEFQAVKNFVGKHRVPTGEVAAYTALTGFEALKKKLTDDVAKSVYAAEDLKCFSNAQAALHALFGKITRGVRLHIPTFQHSPECPDEACLRGHGAGMSFRSPFNAGDRDHFDVHSMTVSRALQRWKHRVLECET